MFIEVIISSVIVGSKADEARRVQELSNSSLVNSRLSVIAAISLLVLPLSTVSTFLLAVLSSSRSLLTSGSLDELNSLIVFSSAAILSSLSLLASVDAFRELSSWEILESFLTIGLLGQISSFSKSRASISWAWPPQVGFLRTWAARYWAFKEEYPTEILRLFI